MFSGVYRGLAIFGGNTIGIMHELYHWVVTDIVSMHCSGAAARGEEEANRATSEHCCFVSGGG